MRLKVNKNTALILVDVQNDFCPGGALPVPDGDKVVLILNRYIRLFKKAWAPIFATRDWHPRNHVSFKERGGIWPLHCVQNTWGAEFHPDLRLTSDVEIISKATNPDKEAYSGFQGTDLKRILREKGIKNVLVGGLATDYCVKNTVLDALKEGFKAYLLEDASKGVDVKPGDSGKAVEEMSSKGAVKVTLKDLS